MKTSQKLFIVAKAVLANTNDEPTEPPCGKCRHNKFHGSKECDECEKGSMFESTGRGEFYGPPRGNWHKDE